MPKYISKQDEGTLLMLFVRDGYVLDFTDNTFDIFTTNSVGEALKSKYRMSKGKSLVAYLNSVSDENRTHLLVDLFRYYEDNMEHEYNKEYVDDVLWTYSSRYNEKYGNLYLRCKQIINGLSPAASAMDNVAENLKEKFSSEYLSKQIDMMIRMQSENPTEAIGKSKELIESCCKTILDGLSITWDKSDDVPQLTNKTLDALNLLPTNVQPTDRGADAIKAVLGNLRAIPIKLAELRNPYGSGHGKSASFQGLEVRHAKLAIGSSITFVDFVWSTYETLIHQQVVATDNDDEWPF